MKKILFMPFRYLTLVTGKFSWVAPKWLLYVLSFLARHYKIAVLTVIVGFLTLALISYLDTLPKPITVTAGFDQIRLTPTYEDAKPSQLNISFRYDFSKLVHLRWLELIW